MSSFDWLSHLGVDDAFTTDIVEVSFKDGASKGFYHAPPNLGVYTGDYVAVETSNGYNVGCISLSGELVLLQLKKKNVKEAKVTESVLRKANDRDLEKMHEARRNEIQALTTARAIARTNHMAMKVSDVEFQGDGRKATIYYTADNRIDFRQLVRQFSHQLRVKIEMRQIGPRQESGRLGGIGSCGRELCCSTWLSDFQSVNTAAARYQNIAINQSKLSGQCGRLKCCLNYELNTYMEALEAFPDKADKLRTEAGTGQLVKTDIFKGLMYYTYRENRGLLFPLPVDKVHEILALNREGKKPADLQSFQQAVDTRDDFVYEDVTGAVELPAEKRKRGTRSKKSGNRRKKASGTPKAQGGGTHEPNDKPRRKKRSRNRRKPRPGDNGKKE
ncbi:PSP1 domain-containing protein [Neolewinella xylanilytica]|nr:regulatory iron-sulfur-containing complex subunit RicT [Neolewinella xylanilytica]